MPLDMDMAEIHQIFFDESDEGLDIMEAGLLNLDVGDADLDVMNDIFRAAHSIKGGAATFGFLPVSEFTHEVETLLDQMRSGARQVSNDAVQLLLQSVDCLREMLVAVKAGEHSSETTSSELKQKLESFLGNQKPAGETPAVVADTLLEPESSQRGNPSDDGVNSWTIEFTPRVSMLLTHNDPIRIFRELAKLGELDVVADLTGLPSDLNYDPCKIFLAWNLSLKGAISEQDITSVFGWVEDECDLCLRQITGATTPNQKEPDAALSVVGTAGEKNPVAAKKKGRPESGSIRVAIDKIDSIINLVGELVITQSMLTQVASGLDLVAAEQLSDNLSQLTRNSRELQESVMRIRMLPISFSFSRFPRLVHDLSQQLNKKIELEVKGETTELDKTVLEKINDPLVHLIRNSIDHGIESPEQRLQAGKEEAGRVRLNAYHEGGSIVIEVMDDGAGLPKEKILHKALSRGLIKPEEDLSEERIYSLIFHPGLSTAESLSDVSGRGVGLDVVKRNIADLGGHIGIQSEAGKGTRFTIRLPLTLSILDGQLVEVAEEIFIISLVSIIETIQIEPDNRMVVAGKSDVYRLRDEYIPILNLKQLLHIGRQKPDVGGLLVVVESDGERIGLLVDELLAQQQVVIKSLESNFRQIKGISGATILGDGTVALILDVHGIVELYRQQRSMLMGHESMPVRMIASQTG